MAKWSRLLALLPLLTVVISLQSCAEASTSVVLSPFMRSRIGSTSSAASSLEEDDSDDSDSSDLDVRARHAVAEVQSTYRNWVGPTIGAPDRGDSACYRKAHIMKTCPVGFNYKWKTCWAQCPLSYPVQCGMECIRQNDDCGFEYYSKTVNVVQTAIQIATMGLYGELTAVTKTVVNGALCIQSMIGNIKMFIKYLSR